MGRQVSLDLEPDPLAARQAREFVSTTVREWGLEDCVDIVQLLTSELVTNGILHARTTLAVLVRISEHHLTVEVHDHDRRLPIARSRRNDLLADIDEVLQRATGQFSETDERHTTMHVGPAGAIGAGRGLLLVETLADEWGVAQENDGKSVWFRLHVA